MKKLFRGIMKFCFDEKAIEVALRANGWSECWHPDNWVHESSENPDYAGVNIQIAFERLMLEKNIVPKNMKGFWIK
jgi:hypothetical protein